MKSPRLSIVIPCLNEADYLPTLLQDLVSQDIKEPFEVIVADSSSDDSTLDAARQFEGQLNLKTTNTERMSAGHTRNAGAAIALGEFLLFLDADSGITPHFLRMLMAERDRHNADMMGSRYKSSSIHPFDRFMEYSRSLFFLYQFKHDNPLMAGCGQLVTHRNHVMVNGYRSNITLGEDWEYAERIAKVSTHPKFFWTLPITTSNRRFITDGRINTLLLAADWAGGRPRQEINAMHKYKFGHYGSRNTERIRTVDLLTDFKLIIMTIRAIWILSWSPLRWR